MNDRLKRTVVSACVYYTAITFIYAFIIFVRYSDTTERGLISSPRMVMFLAFSIVLAASNGLLGRSTPSRAIRIPAHAAIIGAGFYLFILLPARLQPSGVLVGMTLYIIIYTAAAAIVSALAGRREKKNNRDKEYSPIIKK